jgi:membrane associated rhomboid family serine protease
MLVIPVTDGLKKQFPYVTLGLLLANCLVFLFTPDTPSFFLQYAYIPDQHNYPALLTSMFLHSGVMHLVGNMLFLWFVGSLLEIGTGRGYFLAGYLLTGVCAGLAFTLSQPLFNAPLIGASGAIAGLMGAYCLIYGRAKIRVFYSLGFYFDYATLPGWILLPFWLGMEFFQLFMNSNSHIAYMAHIGGLASGAALAAAFLAVKGNARAAEVLQDDQPDSRIPLLLEQGLDYFSELKLPQAREKITEALELEPGNLIALTHLFNIDKCSPGSEQFHSTASQLLNRLTTSRSSGELESYFEEYERLSGTVPRLQPDLLLALTSSYIQSDNTGQAVRFAGLLLKQEPQHPGLPLCLYNLATALHRAGQTKQAAKCLRLLVARYPETASGKKAAARLHPTSP